MSSNECVIVNLIRSSFALFFLLYTYYFLFFFTNHNLHHIDKFSHHFTLVKFLYFAISALMILDLFSSCRSLSFKKVKTALTSKELIIFIILFSVVFIYSFYGGAIINIWSDELYQFNSAFVSPLLTSSEQHQMPLSYFQSAVASLIFDDISLAVRFFTYVNIAVFSYLLYLFCKVLSQSHWSGFLAVLIGFSSFGFLYHVADARPSSLAFIYMLLILLSTLANKRFLLSGAFSRTNLFCLITIFLLTIGFQPVVFVFSFWLIFIVYFLCIRPNKATVLKLSIVHVMALTAYLPFIYLCLSHSPARFNSISWIQRLKDNLFVFNWLDFSVLKFTDIPGYLYFALIAGAIILIVSKRAGTNDNKKFINYSICLLGFLTFFYVILNYNFFKINIQHYFKHRYVSLFYPLLVSLLATTLFVLLKQMFFIKKPLNYLYIVLILALVVPYNKMSFKGLKESKNAYFFDGVNQYDYITQLSSNNTTVYCLSAKNKFIFRYCSGLRHVVSHVENLNQQLGYEKYMEYEVYPYSSGNWGADFNDWQHKEFIFMFMHDVKTLKKFKAKFRLKNAIIRDGALFMKFEGEESIPHNLYKLLVQVRSFIDSSKKLSYREDFPRFLDRQKEILFKLESNN